jgi:hypothetical protein
MIPQCLDGPAIDPHGFAVVVQLTPPQQQKEARRRRAEGETLKELAKSYNVGKSTISRLAQ